MCDCDKSIVVVNGKRFRRLNGKNEPEAQPERGTGFVLIDKPVHGGRVRR